MYYLEVVKEGHRTPVGGKLGYGTLDDAIAVARGYVLCHLDCPIVRICKDCGWVALGEDSGTYFQEPCE